jgi:hypothetical protein
MMPHRLRLMGAVVLAHHARKARLAHALRSFRRRASYHAATPSTHNFEPRAAPRRIRIPHLNNSSPLSLRVTFFDDADESTNARGRRDFPGDGARSKLKGGFSF